MSQFDAALAKVLHLEGGYVNDPADRGGETNFGITEATARAHGYTGPMATLPLATAKAIYRRAYWDVNQLDAVSAVSQWVAAEVFEAGVNCGPSQAARWLQIGLSALAPGSVTPDGAIGGRTLAALRALPPNSHGALLKILNVLQGAHYLSIVQRDERQERFLRGWLTRVS